jgi:ribose transport system substrate-binding protein
MRQHLRLFTVCWISAVLVAGGCRRGDPPARYQIVVIPKGATHLFWRAVHAGAKKAANEHNAKAAPDQQVKIIWEAPAKEDSRQEQQDIVQRFTAQKVSAIVLAPTDRMTLVPSVKAALEKGIPVAIIDSGLQPSDDILKSKHYLGYIATDNEMGGRKAAAHLATLLKNKDKARVLLLPYQAGSESTELREKGFREEIKKHAHIELLESNQEAGATIDTAQKAAENQLALHKDLDGIFTPNESSTVGMLQALRAKGLAGKVAFVGFDSSQQLVAALKEGEIHGLVLQDPFDMGYKAVQRAIQALQGTPPSNLEHHTGLHVLTPDNVNDPGMQKLYNPPQPD